MKELEVKILDIDKEKFEQLLIAKGGVLTGHEIQQNILFNPPALDPLSYLRIRIAEDVQTGDTRRELTLKENIPNARVRHNREYNVTVEDTDTLQEILTRIGAGVPVVSTKDRKTYRLGTGTVEIDTWDAETYPNPYAEIEVESEDDLPAILELLEIREDQVSTLSIRQLIDALGKEERTL